MTTKQQVIDNAVQQNMELLLSQTFTEGGAEQMYVMLRKKYGCTMHTKPEFNANTNMWEFIYQDPLILEKK